MLVTRIVLALRKFYQWSVAQAAFGFLTALKILPADAAINFADRLMRWVGPKTKRHRLMQAWARRCGPASRWSWAASCRPSSR